MKITTLFIFVNVVAAVCLLGSFGNAQSNTGSEIKRFEVGGQFTFMNRVDANASREIIQRRFFPTLQPDWATIAEFGFGGRVTMNISRSFALEAEANVFPVDKSANPTIGVPIRVTEPGGRKFQAVFGPKIGHRWQKFGVFGKVRPGLFRIDRFEAVEQIGSDFVLGDVRHGLVFFNLDIGGVAEYYPSKRTILRFDAGDTIIRYGAQEPKDINPSFTRHNLQLSVGFGFRF